MPTDPFSWNFTSPADAPDGSFTLPDADQYPLLYFPLFNLSGMMSAITPEAKGDIKTGQNVFVTEPQVTENLSQTKSSRNFWIRINREKVHSLTGVSAHEAAQKAEGVSEWRTDVRAKPGEFQIERSNESQGIQARLTYFVPPGPECLEVQRVTLKNCHTEPLEIEATGATPLYGRSADNLRDHRQVTTLLNRVRKTSDSLFLKPTMSFDERGHHPGQTIYYARALDSRGCAPQTVLVDQETFTGDKGSLEAPQAVYAEEFPKDPSQIDGRSVIAAFQFAPVTLSPGEEISWAVLIGVADNEQITEEVLSRYSSFSEMLQSYEQNADFWRGQVDRLRIHSGDAQFDNWMTWVALQPLMRRVFGCSFLPDFGYGRGGRGWRDLWQDCLGLILTNPQDARDLLLNNIQGVRIDGSNATIIGSGPGEFVADRNNIPRTWMDHGVWPLLTLYFYIEQTGDLALLCNEQSFFQDTLSFRCKRLNPNRKVNEGLRLQLSSGELFKAPVLLHLIIQNLTQFYNRGTHGNIRLEDADWNDGLDMAGEKGESVPFTAAYAGNLAILSNLCTVLSEKNLMQNLEVPEELMPLIQQDEEDLNVNECRVILESYLNGVDEGISGKGQSVSLSLLAEKLVHKSEQLMKHIRSQEFLKVGDWSYFNGYYNNEGNRVEGVIEGKSMMSLTAQVFPIMSGTANLEQCRSSFQAAKGLLQDKDLKGFRLNTDFGRVMLNLGRAYSFVYGEKENGAFFSHMDVMFAAALYKRGLVSEGFEVLDSIFQMCKDTARSRIFPCVPEYFNNEGRGRYSYITGSASWLVMAIVTLVFGVRGHLGRLCLDPKLLLRQWNNQKDLSIQTLFKGVPINIVYHNPKQLEYGMYKIQAIDCAGKEVVFERLTEGCIIPDQWLTADTSSLVFNVTLDATL